MNQLKNYSKPSKLKASKTLNASDTFLKLTSNDFYKGSKYINDSQYEPSIEFDIDDQVPSQIVKNNEAISQQITNRKQSRHSRNFSLPEISRIQNQLSSDKIPLHNAAQEVPKRPAVSQSISGYDQLGSNNELASTQRGSSLKNTRVLNPSLTSLHPKDEVNPQQLRALEKLIITQNKIDKNRQYSQKSILIKRDISHLSNSASKANINSVIFAESQNETPKPKGQKFFHNRHASQGNKMWNVEAGEKENHDAKAFRQAISMSEIGKSLPGAQSLEKALVRRNTVNTKNEIPVDPIASFLDKVKNENEEKSLTKREKNKGKAHRTPRKHVTDLHFALSSARKELKDNIIAEVNENVYGDKPEERSEMHMAATTSSNNQNFHQLFNSTLGEKLKPSEYLLQSGKKLTGLGSATGPSVPRIWGLADVKHNMMNSQECLFDTEEKTKAEINSLVTDLKKYVPTALTNAPPSRQDAIGLNEWVEGKIDTVIRGDEDDAQKLWKCDTVYNLAVNEIIRQVSIDCSERGETLYQIWWNYLKMFAQFKQRVHAEDEKIKEACQKESLKQTQLFQETLCKKDAEIEKLKAEILTLENDKKEIQAKCDKAISKKNKSRQKVDDLKKLLDRTKDVIQELKNENEVYVRRLNKKLGPNGRPGHVPLYLAHHKQSKDEEGISILKSERETHQLSERATHEEMRGRMSIEIPDKKEKVERLETSSDGSEESSEEFAYDNLRVSHRPTYLNNNVLAFRGADKTTDRVEGNIKILPEMKEMEVQTELQLVEGKYNEVLESQKTLEELLGELRLKQQVGDILDEAENIPDAENTAKKERTLAKSFSWYSLSHKSLMEDRLDAIGKFSMDKKKLKKHRGSFRSLKALGVSRGSSVHGSEPNSPSAKSNKSSQRKFEGSKGLLKSVTDAAFQIGNEEKRIQDKLQNQKTGSMHIESENNEMAVIEGAGKIPTLRIYHSIEVQEEGKSTHKTDLENKETLSLKPSFRSSVNDVEEAKGEMERTGDFNSLTQDVLCNASIDEGLEDCPVEENKIIRPSKNSEKDFPETPIKRKIPSIARDFNNDSSAASPKSYITDDLFQNLEDSESDADTNDEIDYDHRDSMAVIEEAADEDKASPCRDYSRKRRQDSEYDSNREIKVEAVPMDQKDMKLSMATIVKLKMKASRVVNSMRREDAPMVDKAKLITVTRMYKVEKEKSVLLQKTINDLEEQLVNEKKCVNQAEESINDLKVHIKILEDLKERCPHGKCSICVEEHSAEVKGQQEDFEAFGQDSSSSMWYTNIESRNMLGSRREVDSEIDDGSEMSKVDNRIKRIKKMIKTNLMSQQSELEKKKEKERKENFVVSVIGKVKEKKMGKFKTFTSLSGMLKQISCLYNSRIAQIKENTSIKEDPFGVYVYNWFLSSYGLKKVADQKFVGFALSIRKHIHVYRINIFARFMGLLEGPVNYSLDELNKYLECVDFFNTNTLGTTIVNQDVDIKHYAPFLRGLEYIKNFAEDKMPLEEYTEFKQEFEGLKETDPKNINKNGIIDIDLFMTKILTKHRIISNRTKSFVVNAFKASDLDNNKHCSLKEFLTIYRYIEPEKFEPSSAENLFNEKADAKIEGQVSLSFDKFTIVCVEYGLFSDAQQDLFLGLEAKGLEEQILELQGNWVAHYQKANMNLKNLEKTSKDEKQYWVDVLERIQDKIFNMSSEDFKSMLMAFKILNLEVQRLKDIEAESAEK